jgi:putative transposase
LIRDRDKKYGTLFSTVARSTGIKELKTPIQAPRANAVCERFIGSLKREYLDHMLILQQEQLHRMVAEYVDFYNHLRPHQGIQQRIPVQSGVDLRPPSVEKTMKIVAAPILRSLHHSYSRAPRLN